MNAILYTGIYIDRYIKEKKNTLLLNKYYKETFKQYK